MSIKSEVSFKLFRFQLLTHLTNLKMKNTFVLISVLFLFAMISCGPRQNESKETQAEAPGQTQLKESIADTSGTTSDIAPAQEVSEQTSTAVVLNPPHGQPGHICEIPVGSPLPSSSAKTTPPTKKIETAPKVETAQRLNPPHGEPGHRCEIPVGAPLDTPAPTSAPSAASTGSFTPTVENAAKIKSGQR
jgi:hypothetical protein